jgi:predicted lipoprotein
MSRLVAVPRQYAPLLKRKGVVGGAVLAAIALYCVLAPPFVVQSIQKPASSAVANSPSLSPAKYVDSIWSSKVLPTVAKSAVSLPTLLADLKRNSSATSKRYGNYAELDGPPTFLVKGSGRIVSVNTSSIPAEAGLAFGAGNAPDAFLQLGPILLGTVVRDAMPFINFNQFVNQVTFGEVGTAINAKIVATALSKVDNATLKGKHVKFTGAFTLSSGKQLVTPITLEVNQ